LSYFFLSDIFSSLFSLLFEEKYEEGSEEIMKIFFLLLNFLLVCLLMGVSGCGEESIGRLRYWGFKRREKRRRKK
jgi:hypothetical protein